MKLCGYSTWKTPLTALRTTSMCERITLPVVVNASKFSRHGYAIFVKAYKETFFLFLPIHTDTQRPLIKPELQDCLLSHGTSMPLLFVKKSLFKILSKWKGTTVKIKFSVPDIYLEDRWRLGWTMPSRKDLCACNTTGRARKSKPNAQEHIVYPYCHPFHFPAPKLCF